MDNKIFIDALTYLSYFPEGLGFYQWDRIMTHTFPSIHPGAYINYFKQNKLIETENLDSTSNPPIYIINENGRNFVRANVEDLNNISVKINDTINEIIKNGFLLKEIDIKLPIITFKFNERRYKIIIHRANSDEIKLLLPSETKEQANLITLSFDMILRSNVLYNFILSNIQCYLDLARSQVK